jgi:hypothetical protein
MQCVHSIIFTYQNICTDSLSMKIPYHSHVFTAKYGIISARIALTRNFSHYDTWTRLHLSCSQCLLETSQCSISRENLSETLQEKWRQVFSERSGPCLCSMYISPILSMNCAQICRNTYGFFTHLYDGRAIMTV